MKSKREKRNIIKTKPFAVNRRVSSHFLGLHKPNKPVQMGDKKNVRKFQQKCSNS